MTLRTARFVLFTEARAIEALIERLDHRFEEAVRLMAECENRIIVTGMGKSGLVGRKIAATLASTGTRALFMHPGEALHGDIGMVAENDCVLALSNSGETRELVELLGPIKRLEVPLISLTRPGSTLAKNSDVSLDVSVTQEASSVQSVPTASTTAAMAMGDALAVAIFEQRGFDENEFKKYHPGGQIGKSLMKASELMHTGSALPVVAPGTALKDVLSEISAKGFGTVLVCRDTEHFEGILTDGDLRRFLEGGGSLDQPVDEAMTKNPLNVTSDENAVHALKILEDKKITCLPVVDDGKLAGLLHLHDLWRTQLF